MNGAFALVGPGRAGTVLALGLIEQGWRVTRVAGREVASVSVRDASLLLGAEGVPVEQVGVGAALVLIATPDDAIETVALQLAPSLEPNALVVHCSGARGLRALAGLHDARPDVRIAALHPLMSLPNVLTGIDRLPGAWCAIAGDPQVEQLAASLGMHAFRLDDSERARYHAAASIAANHLVALLAQVQHVSASADVPFEAFLPLARAAVDNVAELGPQAALTGPVKRGDAGTVSRHLAALGASEREPYVAMAREALRLSGRDDPVLEAMLGIPESLADDEAPGPVVIVETIAALRAACSAARGTGASIGLVPTMGYLHEGHRTLMRAARAQHDLVVLTIFVNPLQFAPSEDLATYPRDLARDLEAATAEGVDIVFTPSVSEMYPEPTLTTVHVDQLTEGLCGAERPSHFDGVTTVVTKLFSIVGPCTAYFGRKDAQQLAVVTRMARDLNLPVSVVGCPLVREADGLAMSSRNAHLTPEQRANAVVLSRSLEHAAAAITSGVRRAADVRAAIQGVVETVPAAEIEYIEVRDAETLLEVTAVEGRVLVAVAARVGATRLIDNMTVTVDGPNVDCDLGVRTGA